MNKSEKKIDTLKSIETINKESKNINMNSILSESNKDTIFVSQINEIDFNEIKFKDKNSFKKNNFCFHCKRKFDLNLRRHHCRICIESACDDCSKRKLKNNRICDLCYYKYSNKDIENQKKEYLNNMRLINLQLEKKIEDVKNLIELKEKEKNNLETKLKIENESKKDQNKILEKELEEIKLQFEEKQIELNNIEKEYEEKEKTLKEYEINLKNINEEISLM